MTTSQAAALTTSQLGGLASTQVAGLTTTQLTSWSAANFQALTAAQIGAMTTTRFRAINANDKKFCQKIQNNDTQSLCLAKVEHKVSYCGRIATDKIKKRCLSYF